MVITSVIIIIICRVSTMKVLYSEPGSLESSTFIANTVKWTELKTGTSHCWSMHSKEVRGRSRIAREHLYSSVYPMTMPGQRSWYNTLIQNKTIIIPVCISIHYRNHWSHIFTICHSPSIQRCHYWLQSCIPLAFVCLLPPKLSYCL